MRVTGSFRDAYGKVQDGWQFFTRGLRLLGSDVSQAGRLFTSAALGVHSAQIVLAACKLCVVGVSIACSN